MIDHEIYRFHILVKFNKRVLVLLWSQKKKMKLNLTIWKKLNLILIILLVIGRKVNMAARLMMHYPNKVTCGERTFQQSRLPAINFRVLGAKRMKGLQNVGVIREYVESSETSTQAVAKIPLFQFPLLGTKHLVT